MIVILGVALFCLLVVAACGFLVGRNARGSRSTKLVPLAVAFVAIAGCMGCSLFLFNPLNDVRLWQFELDFQQIAHPPDSERLATASRLGLLAGNGNHCDFYVGEMRWTRLSREDVQTHYAGATIPVAIVGDEGMPHDAGARVNLRIVFVEGEEIVEGSASAGFLGLVPYSLDMVSEWGVELEDYPEGLLYIVQAFDIGYTAGLDLRCH